jgi:cell division protein ZapA
MAHVNVTIAGRAYRMACGEGEEERLEALARDVDAKINEMRAAFGEIGDQRLTVMAAITFADMASEAQRRIGRINADIDALKDEQRDLSARGDAQALDLARAIEAAAQRIEDITHKMNADGRRAREAQESAMRNAPQSANRDDESRDASRQDD